MSGAGLTRMAEGSLKLAENYIDELEEKNRQLRNDLFNLCDAVTDCKFMDAEKIAKDISIRMNFEMFLIRMGIIEAPCGDDE